MTHPVVDLSGYITEGQIVLDRNLHGRGIYPPVNVLPSLSRLMNKGIGKGRTVPEHRSMADQLYAAYARSKELERLITAREIVHENNPVLNWMVENAKVRPDPAGNIKPVKPDPGAKQKIDGVTATVMSLGIEMRSPACESAYEDHGVLYADEIEDEESEDVAGDDPHEDEEDEYV